MKIKKITQVFERAEILVTNFNIWVENIFKIY